MIAIVNMITVKLEKQMKLSKYKFSDIEEHFYKYSKMSIESWKFVEVGNLSEKELSEDSIKRIELAKKLPNSAFININ